MCSLTPSRAYGQAAAVIATTTIIIIFFYVIPGGGSLRGRPGWRFGRRHRVQRWQQANLARVARL